VAAATAGVIAGSSQTHRGPDMRGAAINAGSASRGNSDRSALEGVVSQDFLQTGIQPAAGEHLVAARRTGLIEQRGGDV